jgi:hypothetical protein
MTTRDQIITSNDRKTEKVETPEWTCGHVHVRTLSHNERCKVSASKTGANDDLYLARIAAAVICDETGTRIFTDEDAPALAEKSGAVLDRVVNAWMKLNAVDPAEVKDIEKN